jgi:magnesium-transporting ATPase (P-type)
LCVVQIDDAGTRYFVFNFRRYHFDADQQGGKFVPGNIQVASTISDIVKASNGLNDVDVITRRRTVGDNSIEMPQPYLRDILIQEFSKPFYTYQNFMLWTWVPLNYFYMAIVHGSVIFTGGFMVAYFRYRNDANLYKLSHVEGQVQCQRNGQLGSVPQIDLVPGDVVVIQPGITYCDMALVQSTVIHVDEANLTGESTPMAKTAVDPADSAKTFDTTTLKKHIIYAGTTILETDEAHNTAVVVNTGSYTNKGELLRNVFSYKRHQFKFDTEVSVVITILFFYAIFGFATVVVFVRYSPVYAWFYGM